MKILAIHNYHRSGSSSGDDQVFKAETKLLEEHGNVVYRYCVSNDEFDNSSLYSKLLKTFGMVWSFRHYKNILKVIKDFKPDIVHVHTFFPLLSPSILYAAKRSGCKVVATLHDTRFICPVATSLCGNKICNACGDGHYMRLIKRRCYRDSFIQSLVVAALFKYHRIRRTFYNQIDTYICLNQDQISLLEEIGFSKNKIVKKYNFVPDAQANLRPVHLDTIPDRYVVFYGRIGEEKGIRILMDAWNKITDIPLVVMGSGPLEEEFKEWARLHNNVYYLGYTEHSKCMSIARAGDFVVFPSIWYEGCSMVEIESESLGLPIIATDLGFSSEAIIDGRTGYKFKLNDLNGFISLIYKLWADKNLCSKLGIAARADYESKYRPIDNYEKLMNIYNK